MARINKLRFFEDTARTWGRRVYSLVKLEGSRNVRDIRQSAAYAACNYHQFLAERDGTSHQSTADRISH